MSIRAGYRYIPTLPGTAVRQVIIMIYANIPYAPDKTKNLGQAYNQFMTLLKDEDWACFIDHDAMFTTIDWYDQLVNIIDKYQDAGMFTAKTNRVGNEKQLYKGKKSDNHDIVYHRRIGRKLQKKYYDIVSEVIPDSPVSGVVILIKKQVWNDYRFDNGFLAVDNKMCWKLIDAGKKVYIMEGVYVYHWYRGDGNRDHLK